MPMRHDADDFHFTATCGVFVSDFNSPAAAGCEEGRLIGLATGCAWYQRQPGAVVCDAGGSAYNQHPFFFY